MTESIITFPSKIGSNNPKAYGAVNATLVSGHKQVSTINDLYTIADAILSESKDNTNNDALGQEWYVQSKKTYYRLTSWENRNNSKGWSIVVQGGGGDGGNIVISDTPPLNTNDIWADDSEKSIPEYVNEDLQSLIQAVNAIQKQIRRYEYAFNNQLSSGDFNNNTADDITRVTPEQPVEYANERYIGTNTAREPEYPAYSETMIPNLKHLCIKAGKYMDLLTNKDKFLNNELLWCTDTQRLYIKSEGDLVWINKAGGGGGGDDPTPDDEGMTKEDLDKLDYIGFVAPSGQTYRVKVSNDGKLIVYMKELDTPQAEPTGGQTDPNTGWVYVTSLYLQKLYINSLYCGGLTADEHSYNYCSHNFVELSNLTDADINLNGLSLQYSSNGTNWEVLPLEGLIKKGSTFLIRGAQCSVMDANTTRIKVDTYDMEWRDKDGQLIKFDNTKAKFYLTWGDTPSSVASPYSNVGGSYKVSKGYIDLVGLNKENAGDADTIDAKENNPYAYLSPNRLFTKYYSMDPVSQATKALDKRNNANDWYFVDLTKDVIPMIEQYTPKASFQNKNIFYNKTKLDSTKPNYITCTFGIQATAPNATRCFNWISTEYHDEYLWYRKQGDTDWNKVESFKNESGIRKYYNRIRSEFTDGTAFTVHKVIVKNLSAGTYEYKVVRDNNYESDILQFTVREAYNSDTFTFVQVTDQQGFRWDEYQIWKSSAEYIRENVPNMEFTINTGDMTQNGNRVNEWLDYYTGRQAMKDFEEMPVIGNNDLCPADIYKLGNGGDSSKINPKNLSFFYTFEIDEENPPVFNIEGKEVFVDSLYSFNYGHTHFMAINSEITEGTEKNVYGLSTNGLIYDSMKTWCQNDVNKNSDKTWKIVFTHELPFTIITQNVISNFYWDNKENSKIERSGSHLNYNTTADNKYWFSKFCQENGIRLAIGGHKHTYAATFPLKENPASTMKPIIQVTESMLQDTFGTTTLAADDSDPQLAGQLFPSTWIGNDAYKTQKHLCTFELVDKITAPVYITVQATGYKHTSNKELPSPNTPWDKYFFPATITQSSQTSITAKVNAGQRYPFYVIYKVSPTEITCTSKKINYLFTSGGKYNVNIPSSSNLPTAIGGNGEINNGNDVIVINK